MAISVQIQPRTGRTYTTRIPMITTGIVLGSVGWGIVAVYPIKEMQKVAITAPREDTTLSTRL